jgi:hypothetical protein
MSMAKDKMSHDYYTIATDDLEKAKIFCSSSSLIFNLIGICHVKMEQATIDIAPLFRFHFDNSNIIQLNFSSLKLLEACNP